MLTNFKIDQAATFAGVVFLLCSPKRAFGSEQQEQLKDGRFKWEVEVLGAFYSNFGGTNNEVVKVGIASRSNPCEGLTVFSPVELKGFEVGVMEKTKKDKETGKETVVGVNVWFRCEEVLNAAGKASAAKAA